MKIFLQNSFLGHDYMTKKKFLSTGLVFNLP